MQDHIERAEGHQVATREGEGPGRAVQGRGAEGVQEERQAAQTSPGLTTIKVTITHSVYLIQAG